MSFTRALDDHTYELEVRVTPRATRTAFAGLAEGRLRVSVAAPPVDDAANDELVRFIARVVRLPKTAVSLVRGHTSRHKTLRLDFARARETLTPREIEDRLHGLASGTGLVTLGILTLTALVPACAPFERPLSVRVLVPQDHADLDAATNAALVLEPEGFRRSFAVSGLDFSLEVEVDPDDTPRQLSLFLARETLPLAYGRTPPFLLEGASTVELGLFLARPGRTTAFPVPVPAASPGALAAYARGRGFVFQDDTGRTDFLGSYDLALAHAASLEWPTEPLPATNDGALVGDALGRVWRLTWNDGLTASILEVGENRWSKATFTGDPSQLVRPGAAPLPSPTADRFYLVGGDEHRDTVTFSLTAPLDEEVGVNVVEGWMLDAPRPQATAMWLPGPTDPEADPAPATILIVGGTTEAPIATALGATFTATPPLGAWIGARCAVTPTPLPGPPPVHRIVCTGGFRDGRSSPALTVFDFDPEASVLRAVDAVPDLPAALEDPLTFVSETALHLEGGGQLLRVPWSTLEATVEQTDLPREKLGATAPLGTGAWVLVGGATPEGAPVSDLRFFVPPLEDSTSPTAP